MSLIDDFFQDLDRGWTPTGPEKIRLPIIGSTALLLQTDYERRTKDSDSSKPRKSTRRFESNS